MTLQEGLLRDNFQEIYHALHSPHGHGISLVANFQGTRIYDSRMGWGRVWCWFYRFLDWAAIKGLRLDKLKQAVVTTHSLFQNQIRSIQKHLADYEKYLQRAGNEYAVVEKQCHDSRSAITHWNQSYAPCIRLISRQYNLKLDQLLKLCFPQHTGSFQTLWTVSEAAPLTACQKIIDLEGLCNGPLPLHVLKKIIKKKPLNVIDDKKLIRWIGKINKIPAHIDRIHQALKEVVVRYVKTDQQPNQDRCIFLESFLEDKGCQIFQRDDPRHLAWRQKIGRGITLYGNGAAMLLGAEIITSTMYSDKTRVFSLNDPSRVLLIGQNRVVLTMRHYRQSTHNGYGIKPAQILGLFENGRWGVMERLKPINFFKWTSQSLPLSVEDAHLANLLTNFLGWFVKENSTPMALSVDSVMLDHQKQLKSLKPMNKGSFDFNALEDFAFQCSSGNHAVFQHLMKASGLSSHPTAKYYHEIIMNALNKDKISVEDMAGIYKISDPKVVDRAQTLAKDVVALQNKLCFEIRKKNPEKDLNLLEKEVYSAILLRQRLSKACSILWPSLSEAILERFLKQ